MHVTCEYEVTFNPQLINSCGSKVTSYSHIHVYKLQRHRKKTYLDQTLRMHELQPHSSTEVAYVIVEKQELLEVMKYSGVFDCTAKANPACDWTLTCIPHIPLV